MIYINTIIPFQAALAGRLMGKKVIYHIHEKYCDNNKVHIISEFIFRRVKSQKFFVSQYLKNAYNDKTGVVVYNRLSKSFTDNIRIKPINKRSLHNVIMLSANATSAKGVDIFYALSQKCENLNFYFITEDNIDSVQSFLSYKSQASNFFICNGKHDVSYYYEQADILVNLTNPKYVIESFGMTLLEAMAYGLPIIGPNYGGPKELIRNGVNGYLIDDVTNIDDIKNKIYFILQESNYERFAQNSLIFYNNYK